MIRACILLAFLAVALGQQWTIDTTTTATYIMGVGTVSYDLSVASGAVNGVGNIVERFDGTKWSKTKVPTLMAMATAISTTGVTIVPGLGGILVSADGTTYTSSPNLKGVAQTADAYGPNKENFAVA
eukprot:gene49670-60804_t